MEKLKTVKEIIEEIDRVKEMIEKDHSTYGKGKLSGLYFALGIKISYDGKIMEEEG